MSMIRVRFAPAPTGHLHIGNLRAALFNWLLARNTGGTFLVRIEDTDRVRYSSELVDEIQAIMAWVHLESDEPVVIQSSRLPEHKRMLQQLLSQGKAYRCFCPQSNVSDDEYFLYDGRCRNRAAQEGDDARASVIRIKRPLEEKSITFDDLIHGQITVAMEQLDDFIIARSDGTPIYNFVVVVDDAFMKITHVLRGEDHISNTPKQIILYRALELTAPRFGHLPIILGPSGGKLSKRDAATAVRDYRKHGYLADALCNYLVRLGWSHKDQEIFTRDELIKLFSLEHVGKSGAMFDQQKLDWINGVYIRQASDQFLYETIVRDVEPRFEEQFHAWSKETRLKAIAAYKDRVVHLKMLLEELALLYNGPETIDQTELKTHVTEQTHQLMIDVYELLAKAEDFSAEALKQLLKDFCKDRMVKMPDVAQPLRLALLGKINSPGIVQLIEIVGKHEVCNRLKEFINLLPA